MGRSGLTEAYLERLAALGRQERIDHERLAGEAADHLAEATARYRRAGLDRAEAERRALHEFGDPAAMVREIAATVKEGAMKRSVLNVSAVGALAATVALVLVQILPSSSVAGTPFEATAAGSAVVLAIAAMALAVGGRRSIVASASPRRLILWLGAIAALGALSAWGGARIDLGFVVHVGGQLYLACFAALTLAAVWAARPIRGWPAAGVGLALAGGLAIALNGTASGAWRPLGSLGEGDANMAFVLLIVGWALIGVHWVRGRGGLALRSSLATWLALLSRRLAPTGAPAVEADS